MKYKKELIRWVDSKSVADGWTPIEDVFNESLGVIETLGFVVTENKESVVVVGTIAPTDHVIQGIMVPKVCIKSRRLVR